MNKRDFSDKKVAILGVGIEGIALAKFLSGKARSITFLDKSEKSEILDRTKEGDKEKLSTILDQNESIFGADYLKNLENFDVIFRSPGVPLHLLDNAIEKGVEVSSQIKLFFDLCPAMIIGVTGTKGKGTTSSLIYEILKTAGRNVFLTGNIGYPAITLIPELQEKDIVILELSSFQLMDLENSPQIAVVTNLGQDHLDYHRDIDEYKSAKFNILKYQKTGDFAVLNLDSTFSPEMLNNVSSEKKFFSKESETDAIVRKNDKEIFEVAVDPKRKNIVICDQGEIKLPGIHNLENIAAAALVGTVFGTDEQIISRAVKEFSGLPHRLEMAGEIKGVKYVNDSYATNPDPTIAAINAFPGEKVLILGGSSKGADFTNLAEKISSSNIKSTILIEPEGEKIKAALNAAGYSGKIIEGSKNIGEIVENARKEASSGDIVLFSPACASFGMFENYKDRGEKFKKTVLNIQNESN